MNDTPPDSYLLQKMHQGAAHKEEAFRDLVVAYGPVLYRQIRRITKNHEWTNDCLQNVFIKVFEKIDSFKGESSLYSWLYRIAHNEALNILEKENRRSGADVSAHTIEIIAGHHQLDQFTPEQVQGWLEEAIDSLPDKQAEVFELRYFQDLKFSEISQLTGVSEGGLKANYHHAVKKIEEFLLRKLNH